MSRYPNTMPGGYGMNMRRDGRNPYGSRGGYVDSRRDYNDYNRSGNDYGYYDYNDYTEYGYVDDMDMRSRGYDQRMDGHEPMYTRGYHGRYGNTPFEIMQTGQFQTGHMHGLRQRDYNYYDPYMEDMRERNDYNYMDYENRMNLERMDIENWSQKLTQMIDEKDKDMFRKEKILKKAEELGVRFENFSPEEFYVTVLMMYTDYCKTLGNANTDIYIRLAKDFLMDDDTSKKHGEKLAAYYHYVVK